MWIGFLPVDMKNIDTSDMVEQKLGKGEYEVK